MSQLALLSLFQVLSAFSLLSLGFSGSLIRKERMQFGVHFFTQFSQSYTKIGEF